MRIENIEIFIYLIFAIFEAFIAYNFFKNFLVLEKKKENLVIALFAFRFAFSSFTYLYFHNNYINIFVSITILLLVLFPYTAPLKEKIILMIFFMAMGVTADIFTNIIMSFSMRISLIEVLQPSLINLIGIIFSKLTLALFCVIAFKILRRREYFRLSIGYWLAVVIVPIGSMITIVSFFSSYRNFAADTSFIVLITFLAIINFFVFFVYDKILEEYITKNEIQLLSKQIEYYDYQFEQIKSSQEVISKIKHDMEKHLLALKLDLEEDRIDEAKKSITDVIGDLQTGGGPANSGNADIDAILNYKANAAKEYGVRIDCELHLPYTLNLNATDMAVILGNAIDNAVEACKSVELSDRDISISVRYEKSNLFITIANPFVGNLLYDSAGGINTTKREKPFHGIGLRSIREMIEKYDGVMDVSTENNIFILRIVLFNANKSPSLLHAQTATIT